MDIFLLVAPRVSGDGCDGPESIASTDDNAKRLMPGSPPRHSHVTHRIKRIRGSEVKRRVDQYVPDRRSSQVTKPQFIQNCIPEKSSSSVIASRTTSQRLAEAEERRQNLHDRRVRALRDRSVARLSAAQRRADRLKIMRINKAHIEADVRVAEVRKRRARLLEEERAAIIVASETRERDARKRAEQTVQSRAERARSDVEERVEKVRDRRALLECERRAALLASLDYRSRRASRNLRRSLDGRRERASFDVRHAAEVSTRIKAVRAIQRAARESFDLPSSFSSLDSRPMPEISQNEAARRLQGWRLWRNHVSSRRFLSMRVKDEENGSTSLLSTLLSMVEPKKGGSEPVPFERVRLTMTQSKTLRAAQTFLYCIRPLIQHQGHTTNELNDRTFLSAFLISAHPDEVLGGDQELDKRAEILCKYSEKLVSTVRSLSDELQGRDGTRINNITDSLLEIIQDVSENLTAYTVIFHLWKNADLDSLVNRMLASATQSWMAYLPSRESIQYMEEQALGGSQPLSPVRDDPLLSVRLRHEAHLSGAKSHIKRIRVSLNKLVGVEEGRRLIRVAKDNASVELSAQDTITALKEEIDELLDGKRDGSGADGACTGRSSVGDITAGDRNAANGDLRTESRYESEEDLSECFEVPNEILSNEQLVHSILLTEPTNFDRLTCDGKPKVEDISVKDFMSSWGKENKDTILMHADNADLQRQIASTMNVAFFDYTTDEMISGNFGPTSNLLCDLHNAMRQLVPSRTDLHSFVSDEDAGNVKSVVDSLRVLRRAAAVLSEHLEAPSRAVSTQDWEKTTAAHLVPRTETEASQAKCIPFQMNSDETFVTASIAFLRYKVDLTKADVTNFKLRQVAPLIHQRGQQYEVNKLQEKYGQIDFSSVTSVAEKLPATASWVQDIATSIGASSEFASTSSYNKRMTLVRARGFVDGLLFTKRSLAVPEVLEMDTARIMQVRSEARYSVIGSALVLHACNISGAGASVLRHDPLPNTVMAQKEMINIVIRAKYANEEQIISNTTDAVKEFAEALSGTSLDKRGEASLQSYVSAVISGDDPVLKLLDNRIKQFFRFACKFEQQPHMGPVPMKTGRSVLKDSAVAKSGNDALPSAFSVAACKEASRLGFALFAEELAEAGGAARAVISLCCKQYGGNILDQVLVKAIQDGGVAGTQ